MSKVVLGTIFLLTTAFVSPPPIEVSISHSPYVQRMAARKPQLILYYTSYCPYSQKVLSYLQKINKSIPMRNIENSRKGKAELKEIGGKLQVPCLVIDGRALYESDAIIQWLSENKNLLD